MKDRIRALMYEASLIFLTGVAFACVIVVVIHIRSEPSADDFVRVYMRASPDGRVRIARDYLRALDASALTHSLDVAMKTQCHLEAHALGRAIYEQQQNVSDSIRACGSSCTFGCFHGVLMGMFETGSDTLGGIIQDETADAYLAHVVSASDGLCKKPEVTGVVQARQCDHALGHVFTYAAAGNLEQSLAACDAVGSDAAVAACRSGAYMEVVRTADATTSEEYLKSPSPCDLFPDGPANCYRSKAYHWIRVWGGVAPALAACEGKGFIQRPCVSAIGRAAATPEKLATGEGLRSICGSLAGDMRAACFEGAFLNLLDLSSDDSVHVCDAVAPEYQDACRRYRDYIGAKIYYAD